MKFTNMIALVGVVCLVTLPMCFATGALTTMNSTMNSTQKGAPKGAGVATVIKMLDDMQKDTEHAIQKAEYLYDVIEEVCRNRTQQLKLALYHAITRKEDIDAIIAKLSAKYGALGETIEEISDEISVEELTLQKAREQRIKDNKIFVEKEADLQKTLQSLRGAISILKEELAKNPNVDFNEATVTDAEGETELLQMSNMQAVANALKALVDSSALNADNRSQLVALVQQSSNADQKADQEDKEEAQDEMDSLGAPAADKYKHKSGDIVKLLKELEETAEEQLIKLRKVESDQIYDYNEIRASLGAEIEMEDFDKGTDIRRRDEVTGEIAENKNEDETLAEKIERVRTELNKFMYMCMTQAREYDTQRKNRKEEVEVIKLASKRLYEGIYGETDCRNHECLDTSFCIDGTKRRQIGNDCCACPPTVECPPADNCAPDPCSSDGMPRRQIGNECCVCPEEATETHYVPSFMQLKFSSKVSSKASSKDEEDDDEEADSGSGSGSASKTSMTAVKAVNFMKNLAKKGSYTELEQLANRMQTAVQLGSAGGADPLKKVKGLIEDMIYKLEKEKIAAQNLKIYCRENRERYGNLKLRQEEQVSSQQAELATAMSSHETKKDRLKICREEIHDNEYTQGNMERDRAQEAQEYASTRDLDKTALNGVNLALGVMRDYYENPNKADAKAHGAGRTIISILTMLKADYEKDLVEAQQAETEAIKVHDDTLGKLVVDLAKLKSEEKNLRRDVNTLSASTIPRLSAFLNEYKGDLANTISHLKHVEETCTKKSVTIMEKWDRREKEIDGLQECLEILMTETVNDITPDFVQVSAKQRNPQSLRGLKKHLQ